MNQNTTGRRKFIAASATLVGAAAFLGLERAFAATRVCPPPAFGVSGGPLVSTSCGIPAATGTPKYMAGMADFEVRNLTSVANGFVSMYSTLPPEWRPASQGTGPQYVIRAWSGGAADVAGKRLFAHGGGHADSSNNGLYVFDFNGDSQPTGWSIAPNSLSALSSVIKTTDVYTDGKPAAIHSYNHLWFDPNTNRFYRAGGSAYNDAGDASKYGFYYDFKTSQWVRLFTSQNPNGFGLGSTLIGSPDGSSLLMLSSWVDSVFVDTKSGAVTPYGNALGGGELQGFVTVLDSKRSSGSVCRYVSFYNNCYGVGADNGSGPRARVITVDWANKTWSSTAVTLTGAAASDIDAPGANVFYDSLRDSFWVFAPSNGLSANGISYFYEVSADKFAVTKYALLNPINVGGNVGGGYKRVIWFPDWRVAGTVHDYDQPVSIIKLPSTPRA